jgi:hypothetical protein
MEYFQLIDSAIIENNTCRLILLLDDSYCEDYAREHWNELKAGTKTLQ